MPVIMVAVIAHHNLITNKQEEFALQSIYRLISMRGNIDRALPSPAQATIPVSYVSSAPHPFCTALLTHFYFTKRKPQRTSGESVTVLIAVLEYDFLVERVHRFQCARPSLPEAVRRGLGQGWSAAGMQSFDAANEYWAAATSISAGERIVRALHASSVSSLSFSSPSDADAFDQQLSDVIEQGGNVVSTLPLRSDIMPSVASLLSLFIDKPNECEDFFACRLGDDDAMSDDIQVSSRSSDGFTVQSHGGLDGSIGGGFPPVSVDGDGQRARSKSMLQRLSPPPLLFLELSHYSKNLFQHASPHLSGTASARHGAQSEAICRMWQKPRNIITQSPRTFALWIRIQVLRDVKDMSQLKASREQQLATGTSGTMVTASSSDGSPPALRMVSSSSKILRQKNDILSQMTENSQDALMFLPRFRLYLHLKERRVAGVATERGSNSKNKNKNKSGGDVSLISPAMTFSRSEIEEIVFHQRRAPPEMISDVSRLWMTVLRLLASLQGVGGEGADASSNRPEGGGGKISNLTLGAVLAYCGSSVTSIVGKDGVSQMFPAALHFLAELEHARRRRNKLASKSIVTASAALRNDIQQSNLLRVLETWMKEKVEKTLGRVGNLVGAKMAVNTNWHTEPHPKFGSLMREAHFPYLRRDYVLWKGDQMPLTPKPVLRVRNQWRRAVQLDPVLFRFKTLTLRLAASVAKLSKKLVCSPGDLALLMTRECAMLTVLKSLPMIPGDSVLVVEPPSDGSITQLCTHLEKRMGVNVFVLYFDVFASDSSLREEFARAVDSLTPMVCVYPMIAQSGKVLPFEFFTTYCSQKAVLSIVDGSDALGNITVNVAEIDADVFIAKLDNYMFAPLGTCALVAKPKLDKILTTLTVSYFYSPERMMTASEFQLQLSDDYIRCTTSRGDYNSAQGKEQQITTSVDDDGDTPEGGQRHRNSVHGDLGSSDSNVVTSSHRSSNSSGQGKSGFSTEWTYTGLSDVSAALSVVQAIQFRKFLCFGMREYCRTLARDAENYLCCVWNVAPLTTDGAKSSSQEMDVSSSDDDDDEDDLGGVSQRPTVPRKASLSSKRSRKHSIAVVRLPRSDSRTLSDAVHVERMLGELGIFITVIPIRRTTGEKLVQRGGMWCNHLGGQSSGGNAILAVRLVCQVYNDMREVKMLAAGVIRVVSACGW